MAIEPCARVMHLVSDVEGQLRVECDAVDLCGRRSRPARSPAAPKVRAMEIIDELETARRGVHAGAIGYLSATGDMDVCIAIRSILLLGKRGYVQAERESSPTPIHKRSTGNEQQSSRHSECGRAGRQPGHRSGAR